LSPPLSSWHKIHGSGRSSVGVLVNLPTAATHVEHEPSNPSIKEDEESRSAYMVIGALSMSLALSRFMATMALCPCPWRGSGGSSGAYVLQVDQDYWRLVVVMQASRMWWKSCHQRQHTDLSRRWTVATRFVTTPSYFCALHGWPD
jgi:hypothetical protein